ncbi:MAG: hypothetical protein ABI639_13670, partial [Thermoanaerobaculia bacterium]
LSLALRDLGRPGEADRALAEAFGPLRQADDKPSLARATSYRALAEIERGHFAGIEGTVRELEEVATSSGSTEPLALAEQVAGELAFAQHEFSPARRHLEEAARLIRGTSEADSVVELEVRIAEVVLAAGDPGEAVRLAEAAIAPLRGHGERSILVLGESLLVRIAAASGDLEAARRRLSTLPESAASSPSCRVRIAYLRARAAIFRRSGDSAAARQDFDAAVGVAKMAEWIETGRRLRQEAQER